MGKGSNGQAIARQWQILQRLPNKGAGVTVAQLGYHLEQAGIEVSKRTVERDLVELSCYWPIDCNDKSKPYGWRWAKNSGLELQAMDVADALSLRLIEKHITSLLPKALLNVLAPKFEKAKLVLKENVNTDHYASWENKIGVGSMSFSTLPPHVDEDILATIEFAVAYEKQISTNYGANKQIVLHPLGLVCIGPVSYLIATAFDYADVRMYALHRFHDVTALDSSSSQPIDFNLDEHLRAGGKEFSQGNHINLSMEVSSSLVAYLEESPLSEDMKIIPLSTNMEKFVVTATVVESWQLKWWILSHSVQIEVLEPSQLREEIIVKLKQALQQYT
jgi:predicted DNA-binding transcriptional regulator YafY